jgi:hypothetical protein
MTRVEESVCSKLCNGGTDGRPEQKAYFISLRNSCRAVFASARIEHFHLMSFRKPCLANLVCSIMSMSVDLFTSS